MAKRTGRIGGTVAGLVAAASYITKYGYGMIQSTEGTATIAGSGVHILGVLVNEPASGAVAEVQTEGQCKGVAGAAVTIDAWLTMDSSGRFIDASGAGVKFSAKALASADAAGDLFDIQLAWGVLHA